ncbi:twin transmembrane helix small protein [bacterium]|nr:twin transmembrane helix small protein [bacterium]
MLFKLVVVALLLSIIASLFSGLIFLYHDRGDSRRTLKALTLRVGLSIGLFVLLLIAFRIGLISPG